ncbi:hypothetical protein ACFL2B_02755 [Patescibacteria group bacterium]
MKKYFSKIKSIFLTPSKKDRPSWFIDAKWVCALLFIAVFGMSLISYNAMQLTSREKAVETLTGVIETTLDRAEGDLTEQIEKYQAELQASDTNGDQENLSDSRIGQALNLFFPDTKILNTSTENLKTDFLKNVAVPVYEDGVGIVFSLLKGVDYAGYIDSGLQNVKIYSDETHAALQAWFGWTLFFSILLLLGVIYFSWRFGKLFNAGLVIAITATPGFLSYGLAYRYLRDWLPELTAGGQNFFIDVFVVSIIETIETQVGIITTFHSTIFWIGIALIIAAIGLKIYFYIKKKQKAKLATNTQTNDSHFQRPDRPDGR